MTQTCVGEVRNGMVVFESGAPPWPEGARVLVHLAADEVESVLDDLSAKLLALSGTVEGLPEDYAENLDHYLHGQPKR